MKNIFDKSFFKFLLGFVGIIGTSIVLLGFFIQWSSMNNADTEENTPSATAKE